MIPDFKQQISELEKQKQDLEIRLNEQTEKMKGKWNPHGPAFRRCLGYRGPEKSLLSGVLSSDSPRARQVTLKVRSGQAEGTVTVGGGHLQGTASSRLHWFLPSENVVPSVARYSYF